MNEKTLQPASAKVNTVTIPTNRYIQLLEAENGLLRISSKLASVVLEEPQSAKQAVKPYVPPFISQEDADLSSCRFNVITRRIHATGISVKQWSIENGFKASITRAVICGNRTSRVITAALVRDGFAEATS